MDRRKTAIHAESGSGTYSIGGDALAERGVLEAAKEKGGGRFARVATVSAVMRETIPRHGFLFFKSFEKSSYYTTTSFNKLHCVVRYVVGCSNFFFSILLHFFCLCCIISNILT